jgi:hypothetical protein
MYESDKVMLVACPHCGVAAGKHCVTKPKGGGPGTKALLHTARKALVYPSYSRSEATSGLKRGVRGTNGAYVIMFRLVPHKMYVTENLDKCATVIARNEVAALERLRLHYPTRQVQVSSCKRLDIGTPTVHVFDRA